MFQSGNIQEKMSKRGEGVYQHISIQVALLYADIFYGSQTTEIGMKRSLVTLIFFILYFSCKVDLKGREGFFIYSNKLLV